MPRHTKDRRAKSQDAELMVFRILEKLSAIVLRSGLDAPRAEYLLRCALVSEASKKVRQSGTRPTQSQIALLAGVNRLDVRKILSKQPGSRSQPNRTSRIERILDAWRHELEFLDSRGRPKRLTFTGAGNQFEKLVRKYGRDIAVRALRDNLVRDDLVSIKDGRLVLSPLRSIGGTRKTAVLADLRFLSNQLSAFEFDTRRRAYITRDLTIAAENTKELKLIHRKSVSKIETALNSLQSLERTDELSNRNEVRRMRRRVRIVAIVSSESDIGAKS
jgi:hypothetical protein